jgi:hypothetical protein
MDSRKTPRGEDSPVAEWIASLAIVASWGTLVLVGLLH